MSEVEPPAREVVLHQRSLSWELNALADTLAEQLAPPQSIIDQVTDGLRECARRAETMAQENARENWELDTGPNQGPSPPPIEHQIGIGWRAVLNSGGVPMTVNNFVVIGDEIRTVCCAWQDDRGRPHTAEYHFKALVLYPPQV